MNHVRLNLSRCFQTLVFAIALAAAGCESKSYEVDYTFQVLKKKADGTFEVVGGKSTSWNTASGEGGGFDYAGVGLVSHGARKVDRRTATLYVTYPDQTTATLEVARKETKEHYHSSGNYGIRFTVDAIRSR